MSSESQSGTHRNGPTPAEGLKATLGIGENYCHLRILANLYRAMGEPDAVEVLIHDGEKLVGLRPADPDYPAAYTVSGGKYQHQICFNRVVREFPETPANAGRRDVHYNDAIDAWVFEWAPEWSDAE